MAAYEKLKEILKKAEKEINYGPSSMSVSSSILANDKKIKEISDKIQKIWNDNVSVPSKKTNTDKKEKK